MDAFAGFKAVALSVMSIMFGLRVLRAFRLHEIDDGKTGEIFERESKPILFYLVVVLSAVASAGTAVFAYEAWAGVLGWPTLGLAGLISFLWSYRV